ncbi:MAG: DotU family type IV/VI secretion system protein [Burkholderiaceae bacterium]|jgi:type VI secretion system protein ImpK
MRNNAFSLEPVAGSHQAQAYPIHVRHLLDLLAVLESLTNPTQRPMRADGDASDPPLTAGSGENEPSAAASQASAEVIRLLSAQDLELASLGQQSDREIADEVRFLKAAVADELLLHRPWPGREIFFRYLVERQLYGSSFSGDHIIDRVEALLSDPSVHADALAAVYLLALNAGFEGRLRNGTQVLASQAHQMLRHGLFRRAYRREPEPLSAHSRIASAQRRVVSEQAYRHVLSHLVPVRVFRITRGVALFVAACLFLLAASQIIWLAVSYPVRDALMDRPQSRLLYPSPLGHADV